MDQNITLESAYGRSPQGTLLGSNDLKTICDDQIYVDDTTLWEFCNRSGDNSNMHTDADQSVKWTRKNNVQINTDKIKGMRIYFGHKASKILPIKIDGNEIECV